jgi:hypothetical protein
LRTEPDEITEEQKRRDAVQYYEKRNTSTCISIALSFQKNSVDIDFISVVGWGF